MASRRGAPQHTHRYPRTARINEVLREVLGDALEDLGGSDERLDLVTITGIVCEPDLRHAKVFYTGRHEEAAEGLAEARVRLQAAIARETKLKRTPQLSFEVDPGVTTGWKIEEVLSRLDGTTERDDAGPSGREREA